MRRPPSHKIVTMQSTIGPFKAELGRAIVILAKEQDPPQLVIDELIRLSAGSMTKGERRCPKCAAVLPPRKHLCNGCRVPYHEPRIRNPQEQCAICSGPTGSRQRSYCPTCRLAKQRACERRSRERIRAERDSAGLCRECGLAYDGPASACDECLEKQRVSCRKLRQGATRTCQRCANLVTGKRLLCDTCKALTSEPVRQRERKAKGLCPCCGGKPEDGRYKMCAECRAYSRERWRIRNRVPAPAVP